MSNRLLTLNLAGLYIHHLNLCLRSGMLTYKLQRVQKSPHKDKSFRALGFNEDVGP
jgi:hypothetical protein